MMEPGPLICIVQWIENVRVLEYIYMVRVTIIDAIFYKIHLNMIFFNNTLLNWINLIEMWLKWSTI